MIFDLSFVSDLDEQHETSAYDRVIEQAIVCGREYATKNPARARDGFKVTICDHENDLLFEVSFRPKSSKAALH